MDKYTDRELHMLRELRKIHALLWPVTPTYDWIDLYRIIESVRALALPFVVTGPEETDKP